MAGFFVKVAGTWQEVTDPRVKVAGTWQPVQTGWIRVAGVWQKFFQRTVYTLPFSNVSDAGFGNSQSTISFASAGTFSSGGLNSGTIETGNWVTPTSLAPGSYTIRAHVSSGSSPSGDALDADLALTSNRSWNILQSGTGSKTSTLLLTLKKAGVTVATGSVQLDVAVF